MRWKPFGSTWIRNLRMNSSVASVMLLVSIAPLNAIVLPFEGNARAVAGDQAAVGDGNAVGVTRQIGQHGLRSAERALCVDDPLGLAQRRQISREGLRIGQMYVVAEEAEAAGRVGGDERLEEQPAEQAREHAHGEEEIRAARHPTRCRRARCRHPARSCAHAGDGVSAEPQLCSTEVMPIRAPRCFGSAAIVSMVSAETLNRRS